jgi:hypothetical protein
MPFSIKPNLTISRSGDVDAIVPFTGTRAWLDKLALPVEAAFRPWFLGKQTGGYVTKCSISLVFFIAPFFCCYYAALTLLFPKVQRTHVRHRAQRR